MTQMMLGLQQSVGVGGTNRLADVKTVQGLLNSIPGSLGGPASKLVVNGICDQGLAAAIKAFQVAQFGWGGADGRVDPGKRTEKQLMALSQDGGDTWTMSGFNGEEVDVLRADLKKAREMIDQATFWLPLAPTLADDGSIYKRALLHNFNCDFTGSRDPIRDAWEMTKLTRIMASLIRLRKGLDESVPMKAAPENESAPEAWVDGITDATIHIRPRYFNRAPEIRGITLMHERAHTLLPAWGHPGLGGGLVYFFPAPDDDKRINFTDKGEAMSESALRNPYCFEWVVLCCQPGYNAADYGPDGIKGSNHG